MAGDIEHLSHVFLCPLYALFVETSLHIFSPFSNCIVWFFKVEFWELFVYSRYESFHVFAYGCPVAPAAFVEKPVLPPLNCSLHLYQKLVGHICRVDSCTVTWPAAPAPSLGWRNRPSLRSQNVPELVFYLGLTTIPTLYSMATQILRDKMMHP